MLHQSQIKALLPSYSRKCKFYDLSRVEPKLRKAKSPVMQFYSSINNIGNFLPVLGMQKMLAHTTDTWCMHDKSIDFDFINANYKCVVIGGAGLLNRCFEPFWERMAKECRLPVVIWGVGICAPDDDVNPGVSRAIVKEVASRCDLINVRDDLTAEHYNLQNADISPCPTVAYLEGFQQRVNRKRGSVLFSSHEELVADWETDEIKTILEEVLLDFKYTNNLQRRFISLDDIITRYYCNSRLVVTTRLHGAIIAYGLGIPYIAIPRDEKLRAFHRLYRNGIQLEDIEQLPDVLERKRIQSLGAIALPAVLSFGKQAQDWMNSICSPAVQYPSYSMRVG